MSVVKPVSVRELIVELSEVEDALRHTRVPSGQCEADADADVTVLVHREQVIIHELRRRSQARRREQRPGPPGVRITPFDIGRLSGPINATRRD